MQTLGDRPRDVCSACGTVFYQNPLPAAGALVLDDLRRVLLVKRKCPPGEGMWCLPMGFAELGETIAEAALRELHEETAVTGRVMRLIDVDSSHGPFYGDVLVVTFEVEKLLGMERPGDDAGEVDYFPLDLLPPLAFPHNEKAIRLCAELHRDEWAIHDSFRRLEEAGAGADRPGADGAETVHAPQMLSDSLIGFVNESISSGGSSVAGRRPLESHHDRLSGFSTPIRSCLSAPAASINSAAGWRARARRNRSGSRSTSWARVGRRRAFRCTSSCRRSCCSSARCGSTPARKVSGSAPWRCTG